MKKMSYLLKTHISGMAGVIRFKSGMCSILICQHLHGKFDPIFSRDQRATNGCKIVLCF